MKKVIVSFIAVLLTLLACSPRVTDTPAPTTPVSIPREDPEREWNSLLERARREGTVVIYSSLGPSIRPAVASAFKDKFGINVEFMVGKGEEIVTRLGNERRGGLYMADLVISGASSLLSLVAQGLLDPMRPALLLPEVTDKKLWIGNSLPFFDEGENIFAVIAGYRTYLTVNTSIVREGEIKSYRDLLDPKWKGKLVLRDPTISGSGNQWVTIVLTRIYGWDEGVKYLRDVAKQEPVIIRDGRMQIEWVARGKYPVGIAPLRENVSDFKALGAPIDWVHPVEGGDVSSGTGNIGLVNRAAHPNAAKLFTNWLLSKEGQTVFVKVFGSPSARLDVSTEGLDLDTVPDPKRKFFIVDEKTQQQTPKAAELAKEIFAASLK